MEQSPPDPHVDDAAFVSTAAATSARAEPLRQHLARAGRLPVLHGLALVVRMLCVLQRAHGQGRVHGGLSLDSLLITPCGSIQVCEPTAAASEPTPSMPPEQIAGAAVDERSDIYSAGVVAYELLTGTSPLSTSRCAWPPRAARHDLPVAIEAVFRKALAEDPARRHASAQELSVALQEAIGTPRWDRAVAPIPNSRRGPATGTRHRARPSWLGQAGAGLRWRTLCVGAACAMTVMAIAATMLGSRSTELPALQAALMVEPIESLDTTESLVPIGAVRRIAPAGSAEEPRVEPAGSQAELAPERVTPQDERSPAEVKRGGRERTIARAAPVAPTPARQLNAAQARSPMSQCSSNPGFAREFCVSLQCATARFRHHPICTRLHAEAQFRHRPELGRGL